MVKFKKRLKFFITLIFISMIHVYVFGQSRPLKPLSFGTSSIGSAFYIISVGMSEIILKKTGIDISVESVGGSDANVRALKQRKIDLAMLNSFSVANAYLGKGPFSKERMTDLRVIAQGQQAIRNIVARAASGIKTPSDLKGKRFIGKRPALADLELITDILLKVYDIPKESVKILQTIETKEVLEALKIGSADGAIIPAGLRSSSLLELCQSIDINFLSIPDDKMKQIIEELGPAFSIALIQKGTYRGQNEDVMAPSLIAVLAVRSDFPEDIAYSITKTILESQKELATVHSEAKDWKIENTLRQPPAPFHPGSIKYFKEKGFWDQSLERYQERLLKIGRS